MERKRHQSLVTKRYASKSSHFLCCLVFPRNVLQQVFLIISLIIYLIFLSFSFLAQLSFPRLAPLKKPLPIVPLLLFSPSAINIAAFFPFLYVSLALFLVFFNLIGFSAGFKIN